MLGFSGEAQLLIVCHCERELGSTIRIVSARKETKNEGRLSRSNTIEIEYDLSKLKSRKNPYSTKLKKTVTMRLSEDVIGCFKEMAEEQGVSY